VTGAPLLLLVVFGGIIAFFAAIGGVIFMVDHLPGILQQRQAARWQKRALGAAADALATVISDPAVFGRTRDQALSAYTAIQEAITQRKDNDT
jgi:hypothetical protein